MPYLTTLDSSILSFIILLIIYTDSYTRSEKLFLQYKLFMLLLVTNMAMIVIDILGWAFNGLPGQTFYTLNQYSNLALYIFEPLPAMLWVLYTNYQVYKNRTKIKSISKKLFCLWLINSIFSTLSINNGWFFSIDNMNIYHRGPYFSLHVAFCYLFIIYSFIFVLYNRKYIEKRYFFSLLLFFIPVSVGTIIQTFHYGVSYNWSGMMLSLLIIYFHIQNRSLNTDYLTQTYNRRQLDGYIKDKIRTSSKSASFSAILIDLNDFKNINDKFGHDIGDEALKSAAHIISASLNRNDFLARYGGDEFIAILSIDNKILLEKTVKRIEQNVKNFNSENYNQYSLNFAMGYAVYEYESNMTADDFFKNIDQLMYDAKRQHQQLHHTVPN
ncbi:MAG: GGDEF domain-containing protein [Acidaminococcaceae bacterium]